MLFSPRFISAYPRPRELLAPAPRLARLRHAPHLPLAFDDVVGSQDGKQHIPTREGNEPLVVVVVR